MRSIPDIRTTPSPQPSSSTSSGTEDRHHDSRARPLRRSARHQPIQLLCDCDQPYLPARSGAFQGRTARQVIEEFTLPREPRNDAPTSVIATVLGLEENLRSILNLGDSMRNMPGGTEPVMNGSAYQRAAIRGRMLTSQIRQLQTADVRLPDKTLDAIRKAWQVLRFFKPDTAIIMPCEGRTA